MNLKGFENEPQKYNTTPYSLQKICWLSRLKTGMANFLRQMGSSLCQRATMI
jgi:hypothetical protein